MFPRREKWLLVIICLFVLLCFHIPYWLNFGFSPSTSHTTWAEFGAYLAIPFALLAFIGVIYTAYLSIKTTNTTNDLTKSLEQDKKDREELILKRNLLQEERDLFFKIFDAFKEDKRNMTYEIGGNIIETGPNSFRKYIDFYKVKMIAYIFSNLYFCSDDIDEIKDNKEKQIVLDNLNDFFRDLEEGFHECPNYDEYDLTVDQKIYMSTKYHVDNYNNYRNIDPNDNDEVRHLKYNLMNSSFRGVVDGITEILKNYTSIIGYELSVSIILSSYINNNSKGKLYEIFNSVRERKLNCVKF